MPILRLYQVHYDVMKLQCMVFFVDGRLFLLHAPYN